MIFKRGAVRHMCDWGKVVVILCVACLINGSHNCSWEVLEFGMAKSGVNSELILESRLRPRSTRDFRSELGLKSGKAKISEPPAIQVGSG